MPSTIQRLPANARMKAEEVFSDGLEALMGVEVQVILDKSQRTEKYSSADFLANQGVETMIDADHAISHNKVIVIDGKLVITGSFNFTKAA
jgi:phosphatidylserine/phosphatidylglycerophosphate/cardiolipin synthase-like enzyme